MPKQVTIAPEVHDVLTRCTVQGSAERPVVILPQGQLPRDLYVAVDKVLKALGGKWDRRAGGHQFNRPVEGELAQALQSGVAVDQARTLEQFFTPPDIAARMAVLVDAEGCDVLEPSAGAGALVVAVLEHDPATVTAVDIDARQVAALCAETEGRIDCQQADFLQWTPLPPYTPRDFDRVIMNPPFGRGADMTHVTRAFGFLRPGGRLVAIMSPHWRWGTDRASNAFRELAHPSRAHWEPLPGGTFRASGTDVNTGILTLTKGNDL